VKGFYQTKFQQAKTPCIARLSRAFTAFASKGVLPLTLSANLLLAVLLYNRVTTSPKPFKNASV
jgi:hypothetical protein